MGGEKITTDLANYKLTTDGLGPLRVGMSYAEFAKLGLRYDKPNFAQSEWCALIELAVPKGISLKFTKEEPEGYRLSTVIISQPTFRTLSDAHVGNTEAELKRLYGSRLAFEREATEWSQGNVGSSGSKDDRVYSVVNQNKTGYMTFYFSKHKVGAIYTGVGTVEVEGSEGCY